MTHSRRGGSAGRDSPACSGGDLDHPRVLGRAPRTHSPGRAGAHSLQSFGGRVLNPRGCGIWIHCSFGRRCTHSRVLAGAFLLFSVPRKASPEARLGEGSLLCPGQRHTAHAQWLASYPAGPGSHSQFLPRAAPCTIPTNEAFRLFPHGEAGLSS